MKNQQIVLHLSADELIDAARSVEQERRYEFLSGVKSLMTRRFFLAKKVRGVGWCYCHYHEQVNHRNHWLYGYLYRFAGCLLLIFRFPVFEVV